MRNPMFTLLAALGVLTSAAFAQANAVPTATSTSAVAASSPSSTTTKALALGVPTGSTAPIPAPVVTPAPLTTEQRLTNLETAVNNQAKVIEELIKVANVTPQLVDAFRGLANNVVSVQDQITAIRRTQIPPAKPASKTATKKR